MVEINSNVIVSSCLDCGVKVQYGQPLPLVLLLIEVFHSWSMPLSHFHQTTFPLLFEKSEATDQGISEQEYFDNGILMVALTKAGVELAFDTMVSAGIKEESAYYESLHEVPLIANTIARKKLYEMNVVISDTAEYGCYLFANAAEPLLADFMAEMDTDVIGKGLELKDLGVDNQELIKVNEAIRYTNVEIIGEELRSHMSAMKAI